jgi:hypothetical protein
MDEAKVEQKPKKKIDTGLLVGLSAIAISTATLFVYIYQARIMLAQQHTSVWPRVEWSHSNVGGVYVEVKNKGIGPAIIKNAVLKVDGKEIPTIDSLFTELIGTHTNMPYITSYVVGRVMSPGESFKPFIVSDSLYAAKLDSAFRVREFEMDVCYCSIYNDCWLTRGLESEESNCN